MSKGYLWTHEQQDRWDALTTEKVNLLDQALHRHLDWFNDHATVSDLIAWKKPLADIKTTPAEEQDQVQLVVFRPQPEPVVQSPSRPVFKPTEPSTVISPPRPVFKPTEPSSTLISPPPPPISCSPFMPTKARPAALQNSFMSRLFRMGKQKTKEPKESAQPPSKKPRLSDSTHEQIAPQPSISHRLPIKEEPEPEEKEEEEEHQVPDWAEDPELERQLKHQSELDPDKIFGKIPPLQLQAIFPRL
ncbi:hypothetical protein BD560DRAFT_445325 [Blakeslea trispora]|nr:hypothetical protein BD560DRAFT_445325 [Blakeslea trispora]